MKRLLIAAVTIVCLLASVVFGSVFMVTQMIAGGTSTTPEADQELIGEVCTPGDPKQDKGAVEIPEKYREFVDAAGQESGFGYQVIGAQIQQESSWREDARSPYADGIAQFTPETWAIYGNGGNVFNPKDAIAAQGRYMKKLRSLMEDHAKDDEHLLRLTLASYNAGPGAVKKNNYDLEKLYDSKPGYRNETAPYVENIVAAASGNYTSDCRHSTSIPEGDIVETSMSLAWDHKVKLPFSSAGNHGRADARPEYVTVADNLSKDRHTAYYTDCGVFVASVMITSGADPDFPKRSTGVQLNYLQNSDKYKFFKPSSEGELEPGDILITPGHIFLYTGERNNTATGRAQGASLYTRPPSGHDFYLTDSSGRAYFAARLKG